MKLTDVLTERELGAPKHVELAYAACEFFNTNYAVLSERKIKF
jgi:hypothetical protein